MIDSFTTTLSNFFFEYETPRQVLVRNKRVGVVCRLIQLGVLAYIVGWVFIYEKGYQTTDSAISSVLTKMKGVGYTKVNGSERVWDVADYVFPEQGDSSFVVMTNYIMTIGQKQGACPEVYSHRKKTGRCINETKTCEVLAWCPIENDTEIPNPPLLMSSENYTLFIKNSITFPEFNVYRSNLVEGVDNKYLKTCIYDKVKDPYCPIFRLGDIVNFSGFQFSQIAREGGTIGIIINWMCNLDRPIKYCRPQYQFYGLYRSVEEEETTKASPGYNFRYAKFYVEDGVEKRTLIKVYGIRIDIIVRGEARKFDIIPTMTAIGSGVGIFGVATVVCDLVLLYVLPKRALYKNMKFKYTTVQEEEPVLHTNSKERKETNPPKD
ncbi:P2X purinoceptor 1 isoform X2 [Arapaima gigas]